jgi:hypothetical protein
VGVRGVFKESTISERSKATKRCRLGVMRAERKVIEGMERTYWEEWVRLWVGPIEDRDGDSGGGMGKPLDCGQERNFGIHGV